MKIRKFLQRAKKMDNVLFIVCMINARNKKEFNTGYVVFSNFLEELSLNNLKDFFVALFRGILILIFSCSESELQSLMTRRDGEVVCKGIGVCCESDFLYFLG